jgi:hypothetical protein
MKHGVFTTLLNPSNSRCNEAIRIPPDIRIWRNFGSALPFQKRLTQTKPVLPLSNEHGSQVEDQGLRQCCHNKHNKFPYRPTRDVFYFPDTPRNYWRFISAIIFRNYWTFYLYISLTVHHDINQFVITNLMHICFIS